MQAGVVFSFLCLSAGRILNATRRSFVQQLTWLLYAVQLVQCDFTQSPFESELGGRAHHKVHISGNAESGHAAMQQPKKMMLT